MKNLIKVLSAIVLVHACSHQPAPISEFRGPERTGIYPDTELLDNWPEGGPEEVFYIEGIGNGYGSPVFVDNTLYFTGETDSLAILYAYDTDGNKIWASALGNEWVKTFPGSRSAPTVVGDLIYAGNGNGDLFCVDRISGEIRWSKDYKKEFDGILPYHGFAEAPAVLGDLVFWTPGGKTYNVIALDRHTGELSWSHPGFGESMGYNPGKVIEHNGERMFLTFSSYHLMAFDAFKGKMLWSHEQTNLPDSARKPGYGDTHSNTPLYTGESLIYVAGDGNGGVKLNLNEDGSEIEEAWKNPDFDGFMGGVVLLNDRLYGCSMTSRDLKVVDAETGQYLESANVGSGAVICADQKLFYYTMRGEMILFDIKEQTLKETARFRIKKGTREHFAHPVLHNGILYVRHGNSIIGYDVTS